MALFAWQLHVEYRSLGLDFMHPRAAVMQQQLLQRLLEDKGALLAVAGYLLTALVSHLILTFLAVGAFRLFAGKFWVRHKDSVRMSSGFVLIALMAAIFLNRHLFPMSRAFADAELLMVQPASPVLVWGIFALTASVLLGALAALLQSHWRIVLPGICVASAIFSLTSYAQKGTPLQHAKPNVIVLGVDSLRTDILPAYGYGWDGLTPNINRQIGDSVVFDDAWTPLARTFVSYMSMLTGSEPREHGARFNLYPRSEFSQGNTLAWMLRHNGYHTLFAMDESRFANFDQSFGFDETVTPRVGALDFVIGSGFDFLGTNLLLTTPGVNELFGYVYGNRAAFRTYRNGDHPKKVIDAIRTAPASKPLFLVSHLCLPHWPYAATSLFEKPDMGPATQVPGFSDMPNRYLNALSQVDAQLASVMDELKNQGRLDNALVIVLSDHGESFDINRDVFRDLDKSETKLAYFGHGGFALQDKQYRIVLAMQYYRSGNPQWSTRTVKGTASIKDIAPTIADILDIKDGSINFTGKSLRPALEGHVQALPISTTFVESGIRSLGVEKSVIDEKEVANEMAYLYRIEPDLRFEIRPELLPHHLAQKQRGAVKGDIGVAVMPETDLPSLTSSCWLVADYKQRTLQCSQYPSKDSRVAELQDSVCRFYSGDAGFDRNRWCTNIAETRVP
ncbi:MAG: sulfatase-like hydrolase/transferase [Pseudoxanthomonas sp.]